MLHRFSGRLGAGDTGRGRNPVSRVRVQSLQVKRQATLRTVQRRCESCSAWCPHDYVFEVVKPSSREGIQQAAIRLRIRDAESIVLQCLAPVRAVVGESPRITVVWRRTWIDLLRLRGVSAVLEAVVGTIGRLVGYDRRFGLSSISFNQRFQWKAHRQRRCRTTNGAQKRAPARVIRHLALSTMGVLAMYWRGIYRTLLWILHGRSPSDFLELFRSEELEKEW